MLFRKISLPIILLGISSLCMYSQRVFMTGDSHVYAKFYPERVEEIIRSKNPGMHFSKWAKNGICFYSFNTQPSYYDSLFAFHPDILIVHLGTNGAYANNFSRQAFRNEMEKFYNTLTDSLPEVKVVFVTPFTNKKRRYKKKGKWRVNYKNREASDEIVAFVKEHPRTFVVDNNLEMGMKFIKSPGLIRPDNVHLTEAGYKVLGDHVGMAILNIDELWAPEER